MSAFYPQIARRLYGRLCTASGGCTIGTWLFSKVQYEKFGILTSESIQGHYFEAAQRRKRVEVRADYLLIEISKYKNLYVDGSNVGISTENVDMKTGNVNMKSQSKAEESKAEQKNEKDSSSFCSPEKKRILRRKRPFLLFL